MKIENILCAIAFVFVRTAVEGLCIGSRRNSTCVSLTETLRGILFKTACYEHLGCFYSGPPFYHPAYRALTAVPQSPDVITPFFLLYTRRNRYRPIHLSIGNVETLRKSTFIPQAPVRVITHGYLDGVGISSWGLRLKEAFLEAEDDNVIVYDWSGGGRTAYTLAVANTRTAAALLANLIKFLCAKTSTKPEQFHLVGHSLGGHISGSAGKRVPNIGRITTLDVAGPDFNYMPEEVVLTPNDALFVDTIHTDRLGLGTTQDMSHLDFWPWDGNFPLLACGERVLTSAVQGLPTDVQCRSWKDFVAGRCNCGDYGEKCKIMGYFATPHEHLGKDYKGYRHYLMTSYLPPYCIHQYQVKLSIHSFYKGQKIEQDAQLLLIGKDDELISDIKIQLDHQKSKQKLFYLLMSKAPLGNVHTAIIKLHNKIPEEGNKYIFSEWQHLNNTSYSVDKVEVTYLYPLPKEKTISLLCRNPNYHHTFAHKFKYSEEFCHIYTK